MLGGLRSLIRTNCDLAYHCAVSEDVRRTACRGSTSSPSRISRLPAKSESYESSFQACSSYTANLFCSDRSWLSSSGNPGRRRNRVVLDRLTRRLRQTSITIAAQTLTIGLRPIGKTPVGSAFTVGCKVMVIEIPDDPHPRAVVIARRVLLAMGVLCFVLAIAVFFGRLTGPTWAFIPLRHWVRCCFCPRRLGGRFGYGSRSFLRGAVDCNLALGVYVYRMISSESPDQRSKT